MSPDQTVTNLNIITELSSSMLAFARDGAWEQGQEIEQKRQIMFDSTFPLDEGSIKDPAGLSQQIQRIVDLDKQVMTLMLDSRKELSELANKISSGRQAVSAYRVVQGK
jgi:hypothetical protein